MRAFTDSSALVKLYAPEPGSEAIAGLENMIVSAVARVEVPAALWRKSRLGQVAAIDAAAMVKVFTEDYLGSSERSRRFTSMRVSDSILALAATRTETNRLRAYDAVQLASGIAAREADPGCTTFACFDTDLRAAAAASGFELVPSR